MKVLLSWLQEFLPSGALDDAGPDAISDTLTGLGLVVESVETVGFDFAGVVVAKVVKLREHPDADKVQIVDVDAGGGEGSQLQICCGAFNMSEGDLVPLATIGTVMPNGMEIAARKMRGQESQGMLCSAEEMGLNSGEDGIMILDPAFEVGKPLAEVLDASSDILFDLDVEGNRPDALSVAGVARDLAAKLNLEFKQKQPQVAEDTSVPAASLVAVDINEPDLCRRFGVRVLRNVTVGASPDWMASRITAAGMRPINSIVDISNYVMLELGQPNHTYDLGLVPEGKLAVRKAREDETLTTLDDVKRTLAETDIVVVNGKDEAVGLAGVMGGASTEISDSTTEILLEAAIWDRLTIAKSARRLNLRSEASTRFERGVDHQGIQRALDRFCELAQDICGAEVAVGQVVAEGTPIEADVVELRVSKTNMLLATELTAQQIADYLSSIGFQVSNVDSDETLTVVVPSWRPDASIEEDLIEEVGRLYGYENLEKRVPKSTQSGGLTPAQTSRRNLRRVVRGLGFSEAMPMPFLAPGDLSKAGLGDEGISLVNPLVAEESILRTSLLPGLLKAVSYNQSHRAGQVKLFELGSVWEQSEQGADLPAEPEKIMLVADGFDASDNAAEFAVRWLYQIKAALHLENLKVINVNEPVASLHPTRSAVVQFRGKPIGAVGEVDPGVLDAFDVHGRVAVVELAVKPIFDSLVKAPKYKLISRFPSSDIDLAFLVPNDVGAQDVVTTLRKAGGSLLVDVELFDVFRSDDLGDKRSLAYKLRFQADDRTLVDSDVNVARKACIAAVEKFHKATLRG